MELMNKITADEMNMMNIWRTNYCLDNAREEYAVPMTQILKVWEQNKVSLFQLFGDQLMLEKDLSFAKSDSELCREMDEAINGWGSKARTFRDAWDECFYAKVNNARRNMWLVDDGTIDDYRAEYDKWYEIEQLISVSNLVSNTYSGRTYVIETPDGDELKVQHGCKISKVMGKLAQAFNLPGYEEFRILHSQVLNQKKLNGHLVLSIHPMDYFTMSDNECGWGSCMSWRDYGEYRRGTVEMMNSPCVIVAYLTSTDPMSVSNNYQWNSKKWRELFVVDKDVIVGIKGYPYHNSDIEESVLSWLKELVEKNWGFSYENDFYILSMNDDRDGYVEGLDGISVIFRTDTMYNDFYSDHTAYIKKDIDHNIDVTYSGPSQCMCCGSIQNYFSDSCDLACTDCDMTRYCDSCGDRIGYDDEIYEVDGQVLCYSCYCDLDRCNVCDEKHTDVTTASIEYNGRIYDDEFCICGDCRDANLIGDRNAWKSNNNRWRNGGACIAMPYDKMYEATREKYIKQLFGTTSQELLEDIASDGLALRSEALIF